MCGYECVRGGRGRDQGERARTRHRPGPLRRLAGLVAAVLMTAGMASCGDDDGEDQAASTTSTTGARPPENETEIFPEDEAEQEVTDAYLAYWAMLDRLGQNPDPDDPEIEQRATGTALEEARSAITDMRDRGLRLEPGPEYGHEVLEVDVSGNEADIRACSRDDSVVTDATGNAVDSTEPATGVVEASLVNESDRWLVSTVHTADTWHGISDCDEG